MSSAPKDFDINKLKDRNYKGEDFEFSEELTKGPFEQRKCTDVLFALIFASFLGGMGYMTYHGYTHGNPGKVMAPIDGDL